jgi:hypothetical protein
MANKEQIKKVILDIAGNPSSGAIKDLAEKWATAIADLDVEKKSAPEKETRVTKPSEIR